MIIAIVASCALVNIALDRDGVSLFRVLQERGSDVRVLCKKIEYIIWILYL
jgi:hypothetical protein